MEWRTFVYTLVIMSLGVVLYFYFLQQMYNPAQYWMSQGKVKNPPMKPFQGQMSFSIEAERQWTSHNNTLHYSTITHPSNSVLNKTEQKRTTNASKTDRTGPAFVIHLEDVKNILSTTRLKDPHLQSKMETETVYDVPQILHFIWIGSKISDRYVQFIKTYRDKNPNYQMYLWVDNDFSLQNEKLQDLDIYVKDVRKTNLINREIYDMDSNFGAKSDILRYEVVFKYGGIYTDIDSVAVKPFDQNFRHSFVTYSPDYKNLSNAFFGFPANSKYLLFVIKSLPTHYKVTRKQWPPSRTGPGYFTTCFLTYNDDRINLIHKDVVLNRKSNSYTYQLMDANWLKQE